MVVIRNKEKEVNSFLMIVKDLIVNIIETKHKVRIIKKENTYENKVMRTLFWGFKQDI